MLIQTFMQDAARVCEGYLSALKHADDVCDVVLKLVPDGERNVAKCADNVRLDIAVDLIGLQILQQNMHDPVAVREKLVLNCAADVAEHAHARLANLPFLISMQGA